MDNPDRHDAYAMQTAMYAKLTWLATVGRRCQTSLKEMVLKFQPKNRFKTAEAAAAWSKNVWHARLGKAKKEGETE